MSRKATIGIPESTGRDGAIDHAAKMMVPEESLGRLLYGSPNGDKWFLVRDSQGLGVVHVPNAPSGGRIERVGLLDFLRRGDGPEQQALTCLIGTLVEPK
jgi:hypothetical protein